MLVTKYPIHISCKIQRDCKSHKKGCLLIGLVKETHTARKFEVLRPAFRRGQVTGLLSLNRLLHAEASEVLYGKNTFFFLNGFRLRKFAEMIAGNGRHLRHLMLCVNPGVDVDSLQHIFRTARIRTATFCLISTGSGFSEANANAHAPLYHCVTALVLKGTTHKARREIFAAVRIAERHIDDLTCPSTSTHKDESALLAEMEARLEKERVLVKVRRAD